MLYPNAVNMFCSPLRHLAGAAGVDGTAAYMGLTGRRISVVANDTLARTASIPEGAAPVGAYVLPVVAGGMSGADAVTTLSGGLNLLSGGKMTGDGSWSFNGDNMQLALTVGLSGSGTWSLAGNNLTLRGVFQLQGAGGWALSGDGSNLGMIIPCEGSGSWSLSGSGDLRGRLSLSGAWTPFTELSPEGLATAVWNRLATEANQAGTMGAKVNAAGSASDPWATPEGQSVVNNTGLIPALL